jgi:hypothetical protein
MCEESVPILDVHNCQLEKLQRLMYHISPLNSIGQKRYKVGILGLARSQEQLVAHQICGWATIEKASNNVEADPIKVNGSTQ